MYPNILILNFQMPDQSGNCILIVWFFQDILKKQSPFWNWNITGNLKNDAFNVEKKTSVLFVSVSFIVLMLISLAWLVFYYIQRFRYIHAKDRLERKLCSQAKRALAIISTSVLKKDDLVRGRSLMTSFKRGRGSAMAFCQGY